MAAKHESRSITTLLEVIRTGDSSAEDELFHCLYDELKAIASALMNGERANHSLGATAIVHEAYFRLVEGGLPDANDRRHFLRIAARSMRRVLVDHARMKNASKRGAGGQRMDLDLLLDQFQDRWNVDALSLHEALEQLKATHVRAHEVVVLRTFANHTVKETADMLGVSSSTVDSDWKIARVRLRSIMEGEGGGF